MIDWIKGKFRSLREKVKGWKTVIVAAMVGVPMAALELLEQLQVVDPTTILPEPWGQRVALALSIAMIMLRLITTGPIGAKEKK
jgi:hypothetical protein